VKNKRKRLRRIFYANHFNTNYSVYLFFFDLLHFLFSSRNECAIKTRKYHLIMFLCNSIFLPSFIFKNILLYRV